MLVDWLNLIKAIKMDDANWFSLRSAGPGKPGPDISKRGYREGLGDKEGMGKFGGGVWEGLRDAVQGAPKAPATCNVTLTRTSAI